MGKCISWEMGHSSVMNGIMYISEINVVCCVGRVEIQIEI